MLGNKAHLILIETLKDMIVKAPKFDFLFQVKIPLAAPIDIGDGPNGHRVIYMAKSGTVKGPKINGLVSSMSGGDWSLIRKDGTGVLDVRLTLKTDDDALILMTYTGRMVATEEHFAYALDFAKPDDPEGAGRYYFRTNPVFETGNPKYYWMNHIISVGMGRTGDNGVIYDVFKI